MFYAHKASPSFKLAYYFSVLHLLASIVIYVILHHLGIFTALPNNLNLLNWDGRFHYSIMAEGYEYIPYNGTNMAFFPFFPLLWKATALSPFYISLLNLILFHVTLIWIFKNEKVHWMLNLLMISFPPFMFFAVPYSEAVSFLLCTLIVLGYKRKSPVLTCIGFFCASFAKSASVIFIPAIILCELLGSKTPLSLPIFSKNVLRASTSSLAGLLLAAIIQGVQTGQWFYFFEMQQFWGRHWIIPEFPLHTPIAFDSIAFMIGVFAIFICAEFTLVVLKILPRNKFNLDLSKAVFFSALYLSATTVLDTAFTYNMNGANIWSINRHLLCTPFAIYFIIWFVRDYRPTGTIQICLLVILAFGIYITGIYHKPMMIVAYVFFFLGLTVLKWTPKYAYFVLVIYLFQCFFQLQYFQNFINGKWVG